MEAFLDILIPLLMIIESGGDPNAVGDKGTSIGILQIRSITVRDVNRIIGKNRYTPANRWDRDKSIAMCRIYLGRYGKKIMERRIPTREKLILLGRIWNGGPSGYQKQATRKYGQCLNRLLDSMNWQDQLAVAF